MKWQTELIQTPRTDHLRERLLRGSRRAGPFSAQTLRDLGDLGSYGLVQPACHVRYPSVAVEVTVEAARTRTGQ